MLTNAHTHKCHFTSMSSYTYAIQIKWTTCKQSQGNKIFLKRKGMTLQQLCVKMCRTKNFKGRNEFWQQMLRACRNLHSFSEIKITLISSSWNNPRIGVFFHMHIIHCSYSTNIEKVSTLISIQLQHLSHKKSTNPPTNWHTSTCFNKYMVII